MGTIPRHSERDSFFVFFELSLQSGTHFDDLTPHLPKVSRSAPNASVPSLICISTAWSSKSAANACLFTIWSVNFKSSSRYRAVHFLSTDQAPQPRKQRPYPRAALPQGNAEFSARFCFHPWIHALLNCYTSQLLDDEWLAWCCGWHDDVVEMMVGNVHHDNRP